MWERGKKVGDTGPGTRFFKAALFLPCLSFCFLISLARNYRRGRNFSARIKGFSDLRLVLSFSGECGGEFFKMEARKILKLSRSVKFFRNFFLSDVEINFVHFQINLQLFQIEDNFN